jgi:nucleoid-associated protein YgaU
LPWGEIARANGIVAPYALRVGQDLHLPRLHRVRAGDTLWRLGLSYRIAWTEIARANPGVPVDRLRIGQLLVIPVPPQTAAANHLVRQGDTLWLLARQYGVSWTMIAHANGMANPHRLMPGQRLVIPGVRAAGG